MVEAGLVKSLARPEGNTTGTSILSAELDGKRQEIWLASRGRPQAKRQPPGRRPTPGRRS
jgi:hypothetical protein